jgi:hypothetical protein
MSAVPAPAASEIQQAARRFTITSDGPAGNLFAPGRLRALGVKSAWSLVDQGLTALTGFCATFLLARWLTLEIYGAYAIAFAGYLFVGGLHNVCVLEPMSVIGPSRHAARLREYFRAQLLVHGVMVGACFFAVPVSRATDVLREAAAVYGDAWQWMLSRVDACWLVRASPFWVG